MVILVVVMMLISSLAVVTKRGDSKAVMTPMRVFDVCQAAGADLSVW